MSSTPTFAHRLYTMRRVARVGVALASSACASLSNKQKGAVIGAAGGAA